MTALLAAAAERLASGDRLVLVTVAGTLGSAPREAGARMLLAPDRIWGTIGGGALELAAIEQARAVLAHDAPELSFRDFVLGPELGQCCGGQVRLAFERLATFDLEWINGVIERVNAGQSASVERSLQDRRRLVAARDGAAFSFFDREGTALETPLPALDHCAGFVDSGFGRRARIFVYGAGHVGAAVVALLRVMDVQLTWIDRRRDRLPCLEDAGFDPVCTDRETESAAGAPPGACHLVVTHDHQLDYDLVRTILTKGNPAYCGLIGSKTKRIRFERRLLRAGLDQTRLGRLTCPIGANGLKSKSPEAIALSAAHEMLLAHEALESPIWR